MESSLTVLNFDGAFRKQSFYRKSPYTWIDFDFMRNISLFCEKDRLVTIAEKLKKLPSSGLTFLGSGNYHYVSYLLQSNINRPYTLVLFDHHTDTLPAPSEDLVSCGSWVLESLKNLPMLKKVFFIGVSEEAYLHIPESIQEKVAVYTKNSLQLNFSTIKQSIIKNIPTELVYISIDKDVLNIADSETGWDHGTLSLKQMLRMVKALFHHQTIIGADVCGEYPVNPANEYSKGTLQAIEKNNRANGFISECIKQWTGNGGKSPTLLHA